jgi:23S rRNA (guanosine2251-2'-O)-methyltransferase
VTKDRPRNRPGSGQRNRPEGGRNRGAERGLDSGSVRDSEQGSDRPRDHVRAHDGPPLWASKGDLSRGNHKSGGHKPGAGASGGGGKGHGGGFRGRARQGGHSRQGGFERRDAAFQDGDNVWIWGIHAAGAALANPRRKIKEAVLTRNAAIRVGLDPDALPPQARVTDPKDIDQRLPPGAVHQGAAVKTAPLDPVDINDFVVLPDKPLVILDQVTDPQNVGAIFRSAAAFGFGGVVMQTRNAPALGGALAKAAAGAIESVDEIRAVNISRAIDALRDAGWRVVGLEGSAELTLGEAVACPEPVAVVMGAEGAGLRPGVAKACSHLARIAIASEMESLNVSNAAAIAFYEVARRNGAAPPPPHAPLRPAAEGEGE